MKIPLKVALFDDAKNELPKWADLWKDVLNRAGFECEITTCDARIEAEKELKKRPHIMIVDNVFINDDGNEIDNFGLEFIYEYSQDFSDTLFILFTGETFRINSLVHHMPGPALIVPKSGLPSEAYRASLAEIVADRLPRVPIGEIVFPANPDIELRTKNYNELRSIAEQCFRPFHNRHVSLTDNQLNFDPISGGLSGSHVFRVTTASMRNFDYVPFVMKVARKSEVTKRNYIEEEVERYNAFVRFNLSNELRVDLLGYGEAGEFAGVMYGFAFGSLTDVKSVTELLKSGNLEFLNLISKKLFNNGNIGWYRRKSGRISAIEFYSNSEEYSIEKDRLRLKRQNEMAQSFRSELDVRFDADEVKVGGLQFESIRKILQKKVGLSIPMSVCHGDLNSNNIFVDGDINNISLIDFEYCGTDAFAKDLISLEISLRLFFIVEENDSQFLDLFEKEKKSLFNLKQSFYEDCATPYGEFEKWRWSLFQSDFCENHENWFETYLIGLTFHCFKILAIGEWSKFQYWRILALYCACLEILRQSCPPYNLTDRHPLPKTPATYHTQ